MIGGGSGYTCPVCGQFAYYNQGHSCTGHNPFVNQPGSLTIPPCRAPWNPLTADTVRLIIREELERYFADKPAGVE